jgi:hypothetical protein
MSGLDALSPWLGWLANLPLSTLLPLIPPLLHVLEKLFDRVHLVHEEQLHERLKRDLRPAVRHALPTRELFRDVSTYFNFREDSHFVASVCPFCLVSVAAAALECRVPTALMLAGAGGVAALAFGFMFWLLVRLDKFPMDDFDPTQRRRRRAYWMCFATVGIEFAMHYLCISEGAHSASASGYLSGG